MQKLNKEISIIGYSGHSYVVIEALKSLGYKIKGYLDKEKANKNPYELTYLGFEDADNLKSLIASSNFVLGIGDNMIRTRIAHEIVEMGGVFDNVIHPASIVSPSSKVGKGTFISAGTIVNAQSVIDRFCILNTGSVVEHECTLGEGVHLAPGAVLLGNVEIGSRTLIGGGSVVKPGVKVGSDAIIGAGSVVVSDVDDGATFVGNPAKEVLSKK